MEEMNLDKIHQNLRGVSSDLDGKLNRSKKETPMEIRQSEKIKIFIDEAIRYANAWMGTPYKWGGEAIGEGVDCSGLVRRILTRSLPRFPSYDMTAQGIFDHLVERGCDIAKGYDKVRAGHVLFFGRDVYHITHVAFAITPWHMIEAGGGNSTTRTHNIAMKQGAWVRSNLIEKRADLCSHVDPWDKM
tara:strand:+ start:102 stop:665 length:564 start_codon:yes stop_codon:yes gene_type:complete